MSLKLTIPILSERIKSDEGRKTYSVRPALPIARPEVHDDFDPSASNPREDRAIASLTRELRKHLNDSAIEMRHDDLIRWSFSPELRFEKIELNITLRKQSFKGHFVFLLFKSMERRVVLCPKIPGLSFDLERGESLQMRATEAITSYFKVIAKNSESKIDISLYTSPGHVRLTSVELTIRTKQKFKKEEPFNFASISDTNSVSGARELESVGRCLNRLYPDRLHRAILREEEVAAIKQHFYSYKKKAPRPQPMVLIGPNLVGKTAVIHEFIRRRLTNNPGQNQREIWLLSPQRMISGMTYVGQWQDRAHAIFKEAEMRKHILYFDDLIGLFHSGKSASSNLTVGQILKAYLEEQKIEVLGETTPEGWRKLREIDRGFADFFQPHYIRETSSEDTLRVLIRTIQDIEGEEKNISFNPELLPKVIDLQSRFSRLQAFPGKAVEMLRQLADRNSDSAGKEREIEPEDALRHYESKTGVRRQFLLSESRIDRKEVTGFFRNKIKGQEAAITAMSDLVVSCTVQLNEPGKPMGSLLFLGPTGVGKTECAKALGEYFFGTADRIVRFDMNEFVGYDAVERLIGSQYRPGGLLTSAVRRQPFSVILFDEIEKANPDVFDLLLQLLGEGRLTDAAGQTTDFCNCIVIMTSNLGARSARHQLGFGKTAQNEESAYREAAEKFFRPELFNRFDNIVAFHDLGREEIEQLVEAMTKKALRRIGLSERQMDLRIDPNLYKKLATLGFKPEFGARALRRAIEEFLIEPLALKMASLPSHQPATITCAIDSNEQLVFRTSNLLATKPCDSILRIIPLSKGGDLVSAINQFLRRAEGSLEQSSESSDGTIDPGDPSSFRYFAIREDMMTLRRMRDYFIGALEIERKATLDNRGKRRASAHPENLHFLRNLDPNEVLDAIYEASNPSKFVDSITEDATVLDRISDLAAQLIFRINTINHHLIEHDETEEQFLIHFIGSESPRLRLQLVREFTSWLSESPYFDMQFVSHNEEDKIEVHHPDSKDSSSPQVFWNNADLTVSGSGAFSLLKPLLGTHLFVMGKGNIEQVGVSFHPIGKDKSPDEIYELLLQGNHESQHEAVSVHSFSGKQIHFSSGLVTQGNLKVWDFINPHISATEEVREFLEDISQKSPERDL